MIKYMANQRGEGLVRGAKGTVQMTGLTKKQLDWCNNLIKGQNRSEAARNAYPNANTGSVGSLAIQNWRNKNCQRYLEEQLMTSEIVDKCTKRLFQLVDSTKIQIIDGDCMEVPNDRIRFQASLALVKLQREIAKENPADPDGAYVDTFWQDWYKQEHGTEPTPAELKQFKGNNIVAESEEVQEQIESRLFSSEPIKRKFSVNPKDFTD